MDRPTDRELVQRAAAGDRVAFAELVQRYERPLAALILYRVQDLHDAEDVLQNTLLQALRGVHDLRNPERIRPWLFQIARNCCRAFQRSRQRRDQPMDSGALEASLNRFGRAVTSEATQLEDIAEAFERLPKVEREVARFFYLRGLSIAQIAARTRRPEGTVKRQLFDARRYLRRALGVTKIRRS